MKKLKIKIATRKSPLALWQANFIGAQLKLYWPELEITLVPMLTSGDRFLKDKLQAIGSKGLFVKELETALLNSEADLAVHSLKDMPANAPSGLILNTICKRENPLDAVVCIKDFNLATLPSGSIIGTSSLRRQAQILAFRPDLKIKILRGNVNTRITKLEQNNYDAIILAAAGLERLGCKDRIKEIISPELMLPACGQGALAIECRENDSLVQNLLRPLHHSLTAICVGVERQLSLLLGGNCHVPIAIFCLPIEKDKLLLRAKVMNADGSICIYEEEISTLEKAEDLAPFCAKKLLSKGARELLAEIV